MKRTEFLAELDARLKDAGWGDEVDITPDREDPPTTETLRDEADSLITDLEEGDFDEEPEE